jgi:uncharacterized protein involved in exopolysaccharide biosynthesis
VDPQEQKIDFRDLLWRVRRYGWLIVLPIMVCLCGAAVYYKRLVPLYRSSFLVSVEGSGQASAAVDPLVGAVMERPNPRDRVTVVDSKIHSRAFLGILVDRLGWNRNPELLLRASEAARQWKGITPEEYATRMAVNRLGEKISVWPGRASLIQISATDTDPEAALVLAELIGDVLVEESRQSTLARIQARGAFSSDQLAVYEERLRKAEDALRTFQESRLRKGFSLGIITEQNLTNARSIQHSTEDAMDQLRTRIQTARNEWRTSVGESPIPELRNSHVAEATDLLGRLETNYALALLRAGVDSRGESDALQARIAGARQALFADFEQLAEGLPGDYTREARAAAAGIALDRAVFRSLGDRKDRLSTEIGKYLKSVESTPRDELEFQRLKQDAATSRDFLASLRQQATSSRMSEAMATSALGPQLTIVEHPLLPLYPFSPNPLKIFGMAALLGPIIGAGIVFAGERLASVVRTLEQTETEFGHRVIGTIPRIDGWARPGTYLENNWAALAIILVLLLTGLFFAVDAIPPADQPATSQHLGMQQ